MNFKAYDSYYDSKINWLNELPEHWVYSRLKHLVSKKAQYGANSEPEMNEDKFDYRYIRITDINDDSSLKEDKVYLNKNDAKDYILIKMIYYLHVVELQLVKHIYTIVKKVLVVMQVI